MVLAFHLPHSYYFMIKKNFIRACKSENLLEAYKENIETSKLSSMVRLSILIKHRFFMFYGWYRCRNFMSDLQQILFLKYVQYVSCRYSFYYTLVEGYQLQIDLFVTFYT